MQTDIYNILKQYFGYNVFRPLQEDIIKAVLAGHDTLALLPTGGGKSVCYQIPALAQEGICLVISPLIALIKDQVWQLRKRNVSVLSIYSGMSFFEVKKSMENACTGQFKFLFVSPERLQTALFKEYLPAMPISLVAVDEAHCISQWGYDFRPPYLLIADIRKELPDIPVLALTASATPDVQNDICEKLQFRKKLIFRQSFAKPNLSFSAFNTAHKMGKLLSVLRNVPGCGLVYVRNRRKTKEIARLLQLEGIAASFYHAGLTTEERNSRQEAWMSNKTPVMVCTNAFGMGIDKPDVRTVVHMDIPDCIESYYQEAGRAGRDGKKAYAVLLFSDREITDLEELPAKKFPTMDVIRNAYEAICNYLQIPVGAGEGNYYDFSLTECSDRFKIDINQLSNVLHTLSQAGYISFSENVFIPSRLSFTIKKEMLYAFEKEQPALEPTIKALLRSYEGIFDNLVNVQEKQLARMLQKEESEVRQDLQQLAAFRIVDYQPKKESPQVYFMYDRVSAGQLWIDAAQYEKRKQAYSHKIKAIIQYADTSSQCRSQLIRQYFGEKQVEVCGICDHCLAKKASPASQKEIETLALRILELLPTANNIQQLKQQLQQKESIISAAIDWLAREEKIEWNGEGAFYRK